MMQVVNEMNKENKKEVENKVGANIKTLDEEGTSANEFDVMNPGVEEQLRIIKKGTLEVINEEELRNKLLHAKKERRPLVVKLGLDPSAPDIHLGHTVVLRKIKQLQDLGHQAVIIIGDFTGKIGDPTGKSKTRKPLSEEQVRHNAKTYTDQIFKVIDPMKSTVRFNGEWLSKLCFEEVIQLAATTTVARLLERDDFHSRFQRNEPIGLHEFFYPLMQAFDSVEINADIELGGTDQTFNILMGRNLQGSLGKERQIAIFMPILEGLDGIEKMSKSLGNYIGIFEPAEVMFKKVMEIPDQLILRYFELVTDEHPDRIDQLRLQLEQGRNPRDCKLELARTITRLYHEEDTAEKAEEYFHSVFQKGELPQDMPELRLPSECRTLLDAVPLLVKEGFVSSGSEFRRLVKQGGVQWNGEKLEESERNLSEDEIILKIGKKKFIKLIVNR